MPSLRSSSGCGPTSNSYPALSRLFVEHIDPCCNDCDLTIGDNNIVVNTKDNRVGINTSTPVEALDVDGNIYTSGDVSSKTASFYGDSAPGSTTLNVTGDAGFYGDITSTGEITAGTKLYSQGTIESTGEAKVGSLKVLGVSNLDGNLNVPAGNITAGGTLTTTGNITTTGGGLYVSTTKVLLQYSLSATPTDAATQALIDIVNTNANTITILFNNLKQKLSTAGGPTTFFLEVGYTSSGTNTYLSTGAYSGVTWGVSSGVTNANNIQLTSSAISNTEYWNGIITFTRTVSSGGQKFYQYIGTVNNNTNNFNINGRLSYTSTLPNLNLFRITMSNQFDGVSARYIQANYTA